MELPFRLTFRLGFFGRWSFGFGGIGYGLKRNGIPEVCARLGTRFGGRGWLGLGGEVAAEERDEAARRRRIGETAAVGEQMFEYRHFCGWREVFLW